jgi:TonB-dependent SusC/RagA subfamily outer membrane receptor
LGNTQYRLANNFNFSSLKKRIAMMNKMRSARLHLLRFLFLLPLLAITLLAFRNSYQNLWHQRTGPVFVNAAGIVIGLPSKKPMAGVDAKKDHPEVALIYTVEGGIHHLVIHTDGTIEKFGYPNGPTTADLEKKYNYPSLFTRTYFSQPTQGYLAHWATISSQAEKEFHPTGGNPKAILFPGDSRVIAVAADGKAQVYDMDNTNDPKERPAFEQRFGKLPACVPTSGTVPAISSFNRPQKPATATTDTTPTTPATPVKVVSPADTIPPAAAPYVVPKMKMDPIIIVDGIRQADSVNSLSRLDPNTIESINVLKNSAAAAQYGPSASSRGVILIKTKSTQKKP